jgi:myo-inositol 2-dehydrogenase / D-chiro-inositol 1-dehydrogenase
MNTHQDDSPTQADSAMTRRRFIAGASASTLAFTILRPELALAADANSKLDIGLIGCGGRGKWIAGLFQAHGGYNLAAVADYFQDRVDEAGQKFNVPESKRFTGLSAYKHLLEQKLDAVVIESPPYFHAEQAAAAIEAGKHVYCAKPIAVDVPGCLSVAETGRRASAKKLCFLVDFQTRANKLYQDAVRRIHEGEIGKIISVEANYQCGLTWGGMEEVLRTNPKSPEARLKAWGLSRMLSGDIITEQNIHAIDVASWVLDAQPLKAYGTGGRCSETAGDCWDHFAVVFYYPNDLVVSFNSNQADYGYDDILCRVYGLNGTVDTHYFGRVTVKAKEYHSDESVGNLYTDGVVNNIATFYENVTKGQCGNETVPASVRSNLTTILGRTAAYNNTTVTWKEMMRANQKIMPDLMGLKA